jgi:hypothetical protein
VEQIWVLVPMMALAIPLAAVIGHVVVKPIVNAISKLPAAPAARGAVAPTDRQLQQVEERLAALERTLGRIEEEQDFQRKLLGSRADEARARELP